VSGFEDAIVVKYDPNGVRLWTKLLGQSGGDVALGVAVSATGKVYVVGVTDASFYGETFSGVYDGFVAQLDTDGNLGWARLFGTVGGTIGYAVATDAAGNVFVGGETSDSLDGAPIDAGSDMFVVKLDAAGNQLWTRQLGATAPGQIQNATGRGIATDGAGSVYIAGWSTGGSFDGNTPIGDSDVALAKFDGDGNKLWSRQYGSTGPEDMHGLASDHAGNVYVLGRGYLSLDGNTVPGFGSVLLIKYDSDGNRVWTRQRAATGNSEGLGVATDGASVFVTGQAEGSFDGNPTTGDGDAFVLKYDASGNWIWSYQLLHPSFDLGIGVASDGHGGAFVAGGVAANFDGNHVGYDVFVTRLDQTVCGP
jgi:hypothetical protein